MGRHRIVPGKVVHCSRCKDAITIKKDLTPGYGITNSNKILCYKCCGELDWFHMKRRGKYMLYLTKDKETGRLQVTNWPGSLKFNVTYSNQSNHYTPNVWYRQKKTHVWFRGPDGSRWYGYSIGDMTEVCHVRRLKT